MDDAPMTSDATLTQTGLFPRQALVRVAKGETVIALSTRAIATAIPESNGELLIPEGDVRLELLADLPSEDGGRQWLGLSGSGEPIAWRDSRSSPQGERLVGFRPGGDLRILLTDRSPGAARGVATANRFPRWGDMRDLLRLLDVQPAGDGLYEGPSYGDVRRNVVEGSQLLAQTMVAASKSAPGQRVVSAHTIFSRPAVFDRPLHFAVTAPRRGRNFSTLAVETTQDGKPIASGLVLLDRGAPDLIRAQTEAPKVPGPDRSQDFDFGVIGREVRFVNGDYSPDPDRIGPPELHAWVRHRENPAELCLKQALLAQPTGHFTIAAAMLPHKGFGEAMAHRSISTGVLAITIAVHEDPDLTEWLLYANPAIYAGRGLVQGEGRIFTESGRLVASYTVQAMVRAFEQDPNAYGLKSDRLM
jgi:acyl-CoA thioesterase